MLTSDEIDDRLAEIGWSLRQAARRAGVDEATFRNWRAGTRYPMPEAVERWLIDTAACIRAHPCPPPFTE